MSGLGLLDWIIFCGYLVVVFALGIALARGQRDNEDYFVGGRRMNWAAVGVSLFATAFSSLSFVALPAAAAFSDYHLLVTYLAIALVITPLLWWVFVPVYLRLRVTSVYEYLEIRFNRRMRKLGTILFALYAIGWMGSMVYATGLIIQAVLGLDETGLRWTLVAVGAFATLYTALGGIRAVIWTDVLQAITLGGGMLVVLVMAVHRVDGGLGAIVQLGLEHGKFEMFDFRLDLTRTNTFFAALSLALFAYLPGYTTSQITVQRYLCMPGLAQARRALLLNAVVATVIAGLFFFVGTTLFAFYTQTGGTGLPQLAKNDQILPHFVLNELGTAGLTGLLVAGLFAAVMSTIDSGINSLSAVLVYDWLAGRNPPIWVARLSCAFFGVAVIGAALVAPYLGKNVIDVISIVAGSCLGLLLAVYLLGLLVPRANTGGAAAGLVAGAISLTLVWTLTEIAGWWYGMFTCVPAFVVGWTASYLSPPPQPEQLAGLLRGR